LPAGARRIRRPSGEPAFARGGGEGGAQGGDGGGHEGDARIPHRQAAGEVGRRGVLC
jgi:hypothetical protein